DPLWIQRRVIKVYRAVNRIWPMNAWVMQKLKALAWRVMIDPEEFFISEFADTALKYSPAVFVAHDLPCFQLLGSRREVKGQNLFTTAMNCLASRNCPGVTVGNGQLWKPSTSRRAT